MSRFSLVSYHVIKPFSRHHFRISPKICNFVLSKTPRLNHHNKMWHETGKRQIDDMTHKNTASAWKACRRICLLLALLMSINLMAQDAVGTLLQQFDKRPAATTANQFFDELLKAGFTDEKTVFPDDTPADSLRQQVWYWAAEWMYDRQDYDTAAKYGQQALPTTSRPTA